MAKGRGLFDDIRFFVTCYGLLMLTDIMAGVMKKSSLTTIERRFNLPSTTTALLASSFQIGSLTTVLFASYFGSRWHRPRTIFLGSIFLVVGNCLTALPQFLGGRYEYEDISSNVSSSAAAGIAECSAENGSTEDEEHKMTCGDDEKKPTNQLYVLLVVGMIVNGVGGSVLHPLGMSYIDDFAHKRNSPIYLGITQALSLIGPMMGYVVSSVVLKLWVDIGWVDVSTITITPTHPSWVGAWWLGLLVCTAGIAVTMMPFPYFPKKMEKQQYKGDKSTTEEGEDDTIEKKESKDEKDAERSDNKRSALSREKGKIVYTLKSMATNRILLLVLCKMYVLHAALVGIANFFPKYLEVGFGASASKANLMTGVINIPCIVVGTLIGAFIMRHYNLNSVGITKLIAVATVLATSCVIPMLFIGCDTIDIAGVSTPYTDSTEGNLPSVKSSCNENCDCAVGTYAPVCGSDGISYVSPCHAGCTGAEYDVSGRKQNFTDCSCVTTTAGNGTISWAKPERCQLSNCENLANVVIAMKSLGSLFAGFAATPMYILLLRSVEPDQKSLAIGLYLVIIRVFAWIPGPVVYGALIDSACLYWGKKPCANRAYCKVYDNSAYRHRFYGMVVFFNVLSCIVAMRLWLVVKKQELKKEESDNKLKDISSSTAQEKKDPDVTEKLLQDQRDVAMKTSEV